MKADRMLLPAEVGMQDDCGRPLECAKRRLPTVAAFLIAVASTLVMTFAGCASQEIGARAEPIGAARTGLPSVPAATPRLAPDR